MLPVIITTVNPREIAKRYGFSLKKVLKNIEYLPKLLSANAITEKIYKKRKREIVIIKRIPVLPKALRFING